MSPVQYGRNTFANRLRCTPERIVVVNDLIERLRATGTVPTISKSKPLAFQQLLATINRDILNPEVRHRTDFRYPAILAADRARKRNKGETPMPVGNLIRLATEAELRNASALWGKL